MIDRKKQKKPMHNINTFALKNLPLKEKPNPRAHTRNSARFKGPSNDRHSGIASEGLFIEMLCLERKRAERSRKQFVLMLLDAGKVFETREGEGALQKIVSALSFATRETDITGWYEHNSIIGVIFTEIHPSDSSPILNTLSAKITTSLRRYLDLEEINQIHISFHLFPDGWDKQNSGRPVDFELYPDLARREDSKILPRSIKRAVDIVGSLLSLVIFSPLFFAISLIIKLTSKGPILFRQERVGQYGAGFTLLKFRSMDSESDPDIHKEYVNRFISGKADPKQPEGSANAVYKIQEDPRITRVGKFLRRTSLDELPQFLNVLKGDMSLVGPRPPIPYELRAYDTWHRRRVLEVKPGITGLWQVNGRSRTKFDDMVRLDLRYAKSWSLWLDIKILLRTPRVVLFGEGAY